MSILRLDHVGVVAHSLEEASDILIDRMLNRAKDSGRADDTPEAIKTRLEVQKPPAELLAHYQTAGKLKDIDGIPEIPFVTMAIMKALSADDASGAVRAGK